VQSVLQVQHHGVPESITVLSPGFSKTLRPFCTYCRIPASCVMTMQDRFSSFTVSPGHFQKASGVDEKRVSFTPPIVRISMLPWKEILGSLIRQSPQICCAFQRHASTRSPNRQRLGGEKK